MSDSPKLAILKKLTALIEATAVTPFPGLTKPLPATLVGAVFRGRAIYGDADPSTMVSMIEAPRPGGTLYGDDYGARHETFDLLIQGWCPDHKDHPSDPVYSLLQDVEHQLERIISMSSSNGEPFHPADYMLGNTITTFRLGQGVVRPPTPDVSSKSFFYLPVQVGLARIASS